MAVFAADTNSIAAVRRDVEAWAARIEKALSDLAQALDEEAGKLATKEDIDAIRTEVGRLEADVTAAADVAAAAAAAASTPAPASGEAPVPAPASAAESPIVATIRPGVPVYRPCFTCSGGRHTESGTNGACSKCGAPRQ